MVTKKNQIKNETREFTVLTNDENEFSRSVYFFLSNVNFKYS